MLNLTIICDYDNYNASYQSLRLIPNFQFPLIFHVIYYRTVITMVLLAFVINITFTIITQLRYIYNN